MNRISEISFPEHEYCNDFILSEDEKSIYTITNQARICKYNIETGEKTGEINFEQTVYNHHFGSTFFLFLRMDKSTVVFADATGPHYKLIVAKWDEQSIEICSIKWIANTVTCLELSPNGILIAIGHNDGLVQMYNKKNDSIDVFSSNRRSCFDQTLKFSKDGSRLIIVTDEVAVWDVEKKYCLNCINRYLDWPWFACFCPTNSSLVALCGKGKSLFSLWNIDTNEIQNFKNHSRGYQYRKFDFLPKGRFFFGTCLEHVKIFDSKKSAYGVIVEIALSPYSESYLTSFCKSTKFAVCFYRKICFYDLLNCKFILEKISPLLKRGVAPYICLDIANFLLADLSKFNFQLTSDLMHYEKIQVVSNRQRKLLM